MTEKEYRNFLLRIANDIDKLVQDRSCMTFFKKSIKAAFKQEASYYQTLDKYGKKTQKDPRLRDEKEGPPHKGWVWHNCGRGNWQPYAKSGGYAKFLGFERKGFWRPPDEELPENPIGNHIYSLIGHYEQELPALSNDGKSRLECFLLAVIHDFMLIDSNDSAGRLIYFENPSFKYSRENDFAFCLWGLMKELLPNQEYEEGDKIRANIERAFEHIKTTHKPATGGKADLRNEKPAETLKVWLSIVVLVLGFFGINKYTDFSNRNPSSSPTTQPDTPPVIKSPIDPNIVDINKPISKPPRG
jgi:hypothetical protein